ncbi:hypothetical protein ACFYXM_34735 [Streptomyces sp. NPDC002476]|uniref:hypothetical protein n=1 Tax=Streptomyces sp. NPDC002476 TaxID=3364648 RepID=UPI0036AA8DC8
MSMAVLRDYDRHDVAWVLDPSSGLLVAASGRGHGFVHVLRHRTGTAAALHADGTVLCFQYGERRWDTEKGVVRLVRCPYGRLLTIGGPSVPRWQKRLPQPDTGPYDPAYDWTDTLADDFFIRVDEQVSGARRRSVLRALSAWFRSRATSRAGSRSGRANAPARPVRRRPASP